MASASIHNAFLHQPSPSLITHARKDSRNPTSTLPTFTFNPGSIVGETNEDSSAKSEEEAIRMKKRDSRPPPLPTFSFNPGADLPVDDRPSPTHPVLEEMAMNQGRVSRSAKPAPLPVFTFAPGATGAVTPSPTKTEFTDHNSNRTPVGHKRAGSEFVGGGGVDGPTVLSTSPHKHENKPSGPPRRGHAHRRSQAVSISDIDTSDLIKAHAIAKHRTNSSPAPGISTPPDSETSSYFGHASPSGKNSMNMRSPPSSPRRRESAPGGRPRVEFADKIDVIPRPLSMISSETEGSCSTIRYSHSLNNSVNSISSPVQTSPSATLPLSEQAPSQRPKTADPSALFMSSIDSPGPALAEADLPERPVSLSGPSMRQYRNLVSDNSPDVVADMNDHGFPATRPILRPSTSQDLPRPKTSSERSASLRRRRYQTWTNTIFSKKSKQRPSKIKGRRTPTPPALQKRASDRFNEIFDADSTVVLRSESPERQRVSPVTAPIFANFASSSAPDEVVSPVLDLDAAFSAFDQEDERATEPHIRYSSSRMAKLHSSERRGTVDAFGAVHRRTESAPSMLAFGRSGFGFVRHGSNTSLAEEVFDEEEEDIFLAGEKKIPFTSGGGSRNLHRSSSSPGKAGVKPSTVGGLGLSNVSGATDVVVIVDPDEDPHTDGLHSSKSTLEAPTLSDPEMTKRPATSPMSFAYPSTQSQYASSTDGRTTTSASMISSPDPDHVHFDNIPRLVPSLTQSSHDLYFRPSNDDLPSLSDSISSSAIPRVSSSANTCSSEDPRREQRSASMFVPGTSKTGQSWKRSSLASLNRLIPGSANGSKLRFETVADVPVEEVSKKKANRLSRLVNFWRPKEKVEN